MHSSLSIVIPCYNEAHLIAPMVAQAQLYGTRCANRLEIIVVNDGSTDSSVDTLHELQATIPQLHVITHTTNLGYGAALRSGFAHASNDWIFFTDGDLQFHLQDLLWAMRHLNAASMVCGYRWNRSDSASRRFAGACWTRLVNLCLRINVKDLDCAFKIFPRSMLQEQPLSSRSGFINAELLSLANKKQLQILELPVRHFPRTSGEEKGLSWSTAIQSLRELTFFTLNRS